VTGREVYEKYCEKNWIEVSWDDLETESKWVWNKAALYFTTFGGDDPLSRVRSLKPGNNF
jgi:hypothetical protein